MSLCDICCRGFFFSGCQYNHRLHIQPTSLCGICSRVQIPPLGVSVQPSTSHSASESLRHLLPWISPLGLHASTTLACFIDELTSELEADLRVIFFKYHGLELSDRPRVDSSLNDTPSLPGTGPYGEFETIYNIQHTTYNNA